LAFLWHYSPEIYKWRNSYGGRSIAKNDGQRKSSKVIFTEWTFALEAVIDPGLSQTSIFGSLQLPKN
jgi:hypothetical protein